MGGMGEHAWWRRCREVLDMGGVLDMGWRLGVVVEAVSVGLRCCTEWWVFLGPVVHLDVPSVPSPVEPVGPSDKVGQCFEDFRIGEEVCPICRDLHVLS